MGKRVNIKTGAARGKVIVAIVQANGKFLLLRRKIPEGKLVWNFPGGAMEPGESDLSAAEREVFEETGVRCKAIRKMGQRRHPDTGRIVAYVLCAYIEGYAQNIEPEKTIQVCWLRPRTAMAHVTSNLYAPVKTLLRNAALSQNEIPMLD